MATIVIPCPKCRDELRIVGIPAEFDEKEKDYILVFCISCGFKKRHLRYGSLSAFSQYFKND